MVSNPVGYKSRYNLYELFLQHMKHFDVSITTVEVLFGERAPAVTPGPQHLLFRSWSEVWLKECALNLAVARLPDTWQYVCWLDADIHFTNPYWVTQTVAALQHYMFLQPFTDAVDLGPDGEVLQTHKSIAGLWASGKPLAVNSDYGYGTFGHPGFAWAARREALDLTGGLIDWAAAGSGDHHMALALIGQAEKSMPGGVTKAYHNKVMAYQALCERHIRRDLGVVPGTIAHHFHGPKKARGYQTRWDILTKNQYNPNTDIQRNTQGVIELVDHGTQRSINLREDLRKYFRSRQEDDIRAE